MPALIMKYQPAKKEVEFHQIRDHDGKEVPIRGDSKLMKHMNKNGSYVLQDYGEELPADIAVVFDGLKQVEIRVITTKSDFEYFEQAIERFNSSQERIRLRVSLIEELPSTKTLFIEVKHFAEQAVDVLQTHRQRFWEMAQTSPRAKQAIDAYILRIDEAICNIRRFADVLSGNDIDLCSGEDCYVIAENIKNELTQLDVPAQTILQSNQGDIDAANRIIASVRDSIRTAINDTYAMHTGKSAGHQMHTLRVQKLEYVYIKSNVVGKGMRKIDAMLKSQTRRFSSNRVDIGQNEVSKIKGIIVDVLESYTREFVNERVVLIDKQGKAFLQSMKDTLAREGRISSAAERYIFIVPGPKMSRMGDIRGAGALYDSNARVEDLHIYTGENLDMHRSLREIEAGLKRIVEKMRTDYIKDYKKSVSAVYRKIYGDFSGKIDEYSLVLHGMIENLDSMRELDWRMRAAMAELAASVEELRGSVQY